MSKIRDLIVMCQQKEGYLFRSEMDRVRAASAELSAMQARIGTLEAGLRRIINGEYDNARTIDAAEKFARELLRGDE